MRHRVRRRLDLLEQAERIHVGDDALAAPRSGRARGSSPARTSLMLPAVVEHVDLLEPVPLADLEVVEVVRRRDLHRARALLGIGILVGDDRDLAPDQRQLHLGARLDQRRVALVIGMHGNARVAEHRLGPRRGDDDVVLVVARHLRRQRIAEVVHVPGRIVRQHLAERFGIERLLRIAVRSTRTCRAPRPAPPRGRRSPSGTSGPS